MVAIDKIVCVAMMIDVKRTIDVTRIDERAWRFAAELFAGQPLGPALDAADTLDAPALLAEHIAAGRFIGFSLADAVTHLRARERLP